MHRFFAAYCILNLTNMIGQMVDNTGEIKIHNRRGGGGRRNYREIWNEEGGRSFREREKEKMMRNDEIK